MRKNQPGDDIRRLLELDGTTIYQQDKHWVKIDAWEIEPTPQVPHGIRYSLTLHNQHNTRVLGFDNAHVPKGGKRRRYRGRIRIYDHLHTDENCKGVPYAFSSAENLMTDFWSAVDEYFRVNDPPPTG